MNVAESLDQITYIGLGVFILVLVLSLSFGEYAVNAAQISTSFGAPALILPAIPITLTNNQNANSLASFQQMISFNALAVCTPSLCAPHLNNTEFLFANGTLINSWYESANGLSNNYGSNTFATSNGVTVWLDIPPANFILGHRSNTIYMGFAVNTVNLFSQSGPTGEAPQLTCPDANTAACGGNYGAFDNGQQVFNYYDNFAGASDANWVAPAANPGTATVANGLSVTAAIVSNYGNIQSLYTFPVSGRLYGNQTLDSLFQQTGGLGQGGLNDFSFGGATSMSAIGSGGTQYWRFTRGATNNNFATTANNPIQVVSIFSNATLGIGMVNYTTTNTIVTGASSTGNIILTTYNYGNGQVMFLQWIRIRTMPANSIMPTASLGSISSLSIGTGSQFGVLYNWTRYGGALPNSFGSVLQLAVFSLVFIAIILAVVGAIKGNRGESTSGGFLR